MRQVFAAMSVLAMGSMVVVGCAGESEEAKRVRAEAPALQARLKLVLDNAPDLDPLGKPGVERPKSIYDEPRPCPDGELVDRVKGGERDVVLMYAEDLRAIGGTPLPSGGMHAVVSEVISKSTLRGLEPLGPEPTEWEVGEWVDALDLAAKRPWTVVFWPRWATAGEVDGFNKTFESAFIQGIVALHDPTSGAPLCWQTLTVMNSDTLRADWDGKNSNMAADMRKNLEAKLPEVLAKLSRIMRVPEFGSADPASEPVTMTPEEQATELKTSLEKTLLSPVLQHVRELEVAEQKCDDEAMKSATQGRDKALVVVDHLHLYRQSIGKEPEALRWMASPELLHIYSTEGGPGVVRARHAALREHRYLAVFKRSDADNEALLGHLVIYDIDDAKHVCTTGPVAAKGKDEATLKASFQDKAAKALAAVSSVLTL